MIISQKAGSTWQVVACNIGRLPQSYCRWVSLLSLDGQLVRHLFRYPAQWWVIAAFNTDAPDALQVIIPSPCVLPGLILWVDSAILAWDSIIDVNQYRFADDKTGQRPLPAPWQYFSYDTLELHRTFFTRQGFHFFWGQRVKPDFSNSLVPFGYSQLERTFAVP